MLIDEVEGGLVFVEIEGGCLLVDEVEGGLCYLT